MNILITTPWPPAITGGISTIVVELARRLAERGHHVDVLITNGGNSIEHHNVGPLPYYSLYCRVPDAERSRVRSLLAFALFLPLTVLRLRSFLAALQVDLVIVQYPIPQAFYFGLLRRITRARLQVVFQGNDAHDLCKYSALSRRLMRLLLGAADSVLAVSGTLLEKVRAALPDAVPHSAEIVPNGAALDAIAGAIPTSGDHIDGPIVLTVGQLIHRKGIDIDIAALALAVKEGSQLHLVVAGDGPERQPLLDLAQRLGMADRVHFLGNLAHKDVVGWMKRCTFFCLGSRAEGLPLVLAEAMACGKTAVATNVDGIPDIVLQGRTGLLVENEDARGMAKAFLELERNPSLRTRLETEANLSAQSTFNWDVITERYLRAAGVVSDTRRPSGA